MLDEIESKPCRLSVYRLASYESDADFLRALGLDDADGLQEMQELFQSSSVHSGADTLLDRPFRSRGQYWRRRQRQLTRTRFSDGTFPVFYASLEIQTSEAEVKHWLLHGLPELPTQPRTLYYYCQFKCDFKGTVKDLRPMLRQWPNLTHPTDYAFCIELGSEAVGMNLDALLTPSARRSCGTNVPIFKRGALSNVQEMEMVSLTIDYKHRSVRAKPVKLPYYRRADY